MALVHDRETPALTSDLNDLRVLTYQCPSVGDQVATGSAYDDRMLVSRPVYSQETFDAAESARGANARESRTTRQRLTDQLAKSCRCDRKKTLNLFLDQVPVLRWLPKYDFKQNLLGDLMAGFTISVLHLPQVKTNTLWDKARSF